MRDEAEIKGHRRTYIGAMPGKFVQALKEVQVSNPVIMLDEIDKIGASLPGRPGLGAAGGAGPGAEQRVPRSLPGPARGPLQGVCSSAPPTSSTPFPARCWTAWRRCACPATWRRRSCPSRADTCGPSSCSGTGSRTKQLKINDAALKYVIDSYCREAGVRNLEKQLGRIMRKCIVRRLLDGEEERKARGQEGYRGSARASRRSSPSKPLRGLGVATGLAWTAMGGATLADRVLPDTHSQPRFQADRASRRRDARSPRKSPTATSSRATSRTTAATRTFSI